MGLFISMEGPDGSGKTLQMDLLQKELEKQGYSVLRTREPGGTPIGERIRKLLLDPECREMSAQTEALLYAAARAQHVSQKIVPALREGKIVLCDRFVDSSLVYQGIGRGLGVEQIRELNRFATGETGAGCHNCTSDRLCGGASAQEQTVCGTAGPYGAAAGKLPSKGT